MNKKEYTEFNKEANRLSDKILSLLERENNTNKITLKAIRVAEQKIYSKLMSV